MKVWELIRILENVKDKNIDVYFPNDDNYYNDDYSVDSVTIDKNYVLLESDYDITLECR